jgi:hypothetical protein
MPRQPNTVATVHITLSTTPQVQNYLANLAVSGLYGKTPAEAGERLIARELERLIASGVIPRASKPTRLNRGARGYRALGHAGSQGR